MGRTIITALSSDINEVALEDLSALNLVRDYDIWCHYKESDNPIIRKYISEHNLKKIIAIPESAGLYVHNNNIETVGPSNVTVFGFTKDIYQPWQLIK